MVKEFLPKANDWKEHELLELAKVSENFTGDEIRVACKEASMIVIRKSLDESGGKQKPEAVKFEHLHQALKQMKPSSANLVEKHREWNKKCGNQT
jgi:katanin p60 ATPase-containing subunit A1